MALATGVPVGGGVGFMVGGGPVGGGPKAGLVVWYVWGAIGGGAEPG